MKLLDSNILIYAPQPAYAHLLPLLVDPTCYVSEITRLEVLGFHRLNSQEKAYYERVFRHKVVLPITVDVINQAILLRQAQKMSIGDAIIAATSVVHGFELQTNNVADFQHIPGLVLNNPL